MHVQIGLLLLALSATACEPLVECSAQVTTGNGTFRGTADGRGDRAAIERKAVKEACARLCDANPERDDTCAARCTADAAAGKVGHRSKCAEGR